MSQQKIPERMEQNWMSNSVPKSRCPPAKPPRRKLSYDSESGKLTGSESSSTVSLGALSSNPSPTRPNLKLQSFSKPSSSGFSSSKDTSPVVQEGSDYGSLHAENQILQPQNTNWSGPGLLQMDSPCSLDHESYRQMFISTPKAHDCGHSFPSPSGHNRTSKYIPSSPASVYFTPTAESDVSIERIQGLPSDKKSNPSRRHNSDPQISVDRRPPRSVFRRRLVDRNRSRSFISGDEPVSLPLNNHEGQNENCQPHFPSCYLCMGQFPNDPLILAKEVKMLRTICDKLWIQLQQSQLKLEYIPKQSSPSMNKVQNFSDLLSEIYYAQKERDRAVQERLKIVLEERDNLYSEIDRLKDVIFRRNHFQSSNHEDSISEDMQDVDEVLENLGLLTSPRKIEEEKNKLLFHIGNAKDRRKQQFSQQLRNVMAERDLAISKVSEERVKTFEKMEDLQEELTSLKLCYSLVQDDENPTSKTLEEPICFFDLEQTTSSTENGTNKNNVNHFKMKLLQENQARLEAEEKCKKLERLVLVLRKKVKGGSMGVPV